MQWSASALVSPPDEPSPRSAGSARVALPDLEHRPPAFGQRVDVRGAVGAGRVRDADPGADLDAIVAAAAVACGHHRPQPFVGPVDEADPRIAAGVDAGAAADAQPRLGNLAGIAQPHDRQRQVQAVMYPVQQGHHAGSDAGHRRCELRPRAPALVVGAQHLAAASAIVTWRGSITSAPAPTLSNTPANLSL